MFHGPTVPQPHWVGTLLEMHLGGCEVGAILLRVLELPRATALSGLGSTSQSFETQVARLRLLQVALVGERAGVGGWGEEISGQQRWVVGKLGAGMLSRQRRD